MPRSGGCRDGEGESRIVAGDEATTLESPREKRPASVRQRFRVRLLARRPSRNIRRRPRRRTGRRSVQEGAIRLRRELGLDPRGADPRDLLESLQRGHALFDHRGKLLVREERVSRKSVLLRHRLPQVPQFRVDREIGFGENFTIIDTLPRFRSGAAASIEVTHADRPSAAGTVRYEMTFHHQHAIRRKTSRLMFGEGWRIVPGGMPTSSWACSQTLGPPGHAHEDVGMLPGIDPLLDTDLRT